MKRKKVIGVKQEWKFVKEGCVRTTTHVPPKRKRSCQHAKACVAHTNLFFKIIFYVYLSTKLLLTSLIINKKKKHKKRKKKPLEVGFTNFLFKEIKIILLFRKKKMMSKPLVVRLFFFVAFEGK